MPEVLCINVEDDGTKVFVAERRQRRQELLAVSRFTELTAGQARPEVVKQTIATQTPGTTFSLLAYLGHGSPGILYYEHKRGHKLLAQDEAPEALKPVVGGKAVYIFACRTMTRQFADVLLRADATRAAGFTCSPEHSETNGLQRLGDFDMYAIKAMFRGEPTDLILQRRDGMVEQARQDKAKNLGFKFGKSMTQFITALNSFAVYE